MTTPAYLASGETARNLRASMSVFAVLIERSVSRLAGNEAHLLIRSTTRMGHTPHLSRREILQSIPVLGPGSLLLPVSVLRGQRPDTSAPAIIRGSLVDGATGQPVAAKIRVVNTNTDEVYMPATAIKTMPKSIKPGARRYSNARGSYEVAVPPGRYQIEVVRWISHEAVVQYTEVGSGITHVHDFRIPVLKDLHTSGWYSGNTHPLCA